MGCMAFSHGYGQIPSETYSIEAIRNAYKHGCTFFDTAEVYACHNVMVEKRNTQLSDQLRRFREQEKSQLNIQNI